MRTLLVGLVLACAGLFAAGWGRTAPAPSVRVIQDQVVVNNPARDGVRVVYEMVRVPTPSPPPSVSVRRTAAIRLVRVEAPRTGVIERTRRLIVGDGRHKPRPFPTVRP